MAFQRGIEKGHAERVMEETATHVGLNIGAYKEAAEHHLNALSM